MAAASQNQVDGQGGNQVAQAIKAEVISQGPNLKPFREPNLTPCALGFSNAISILDKRRP